MFSNFNIGFGCCQNTCCNTVSEQCCPEDPVYEAPIEKCIKKDYIHEVVHVVPIHTNVINNHIYKHSYVPEYTCSEENICTNVNECGFNNNL